MKTIYRNLLSVIRRFKMATLLNVAGLSVAFAAFMVIMMQIDYDWTFDTSDPNHANIFRVEFIYQESAQVVINRPLAEAFFASSPHIVAGALSFPHSTDLFFSVENNGIKQFYEEKSVQVSPEYTDVFTFDFVEGTKDVLKQPDHVMIPLSMAQKLFGNESAAGRQLTGRYSHMTVGAVYRDFPANTLVQNIVYTTIPENENKTDWGNWNYQVFVRMDDADNLSSVYENFKKNNKANPQMIGQTDEVDWEKLNAGLRFTPLTEVHYVTDAIFDFTPKASRQTLRVLFAIAIVVIVIAGINFTNFSTALTPMRIKSINTQKVLGGSQSTIRRSLVLEAMLISLFSYGMAIGLVMLFARTELSSLVDADLSVASQPLIVGGTALIALLTGLLAGLYPSFYMTSFPPALVLKGSFGLSPKGRVLRNALISVQFIASFALLIGASFMYLQNHFMQHTPLGYEKDALIVTNINEQINKSIDAFTNRMKEFAGVEGVTYADQLISSTDFYMSWGRDYHDKKIQYQVLPVDYSFLDVMGISVTEGREFRIEDANTRHGVYVFNEKARDQFQLEVGTMIDSTEIVGIIPDVKFASFRTEVAPMAFFVWGSQNWGRWKNHAYVRVKAGSDMRAAMEHMRTTLTEFDPEYPFNVRFFDDVLQRLYEKEAAISMLITLFSLIAIFISIVGVFGLVVFDSEYRKKEIGIRKVFGSTTQQILVMFNKTYLKIVAVCFVFAAPAAYYAVVKWLENFAYKTPLYWWVFALSFAIVALVTFATVTFQNWRAANANPVKSLRSE
ncbi:ABC transporter permease [Tannerella sp.]|uniref:ABC transporter permease n=1 Tax=Tannerella sp. TaxID=2382127 RepID=UPI0026DD0569|nr:ABC transporter permease [Tannerella sp.]MDO4704476.1 ABC transporter permease [Tannerella sp.]